MCLIWQLFLKHISCHFPRPSETQMIPYRNTPWYIYLLFLADKIFHVTISRLMSIGIEKHQLLSVFMLTYYQHRLRNMSTPLHLLYSGHPARIQVAFIFWLGACSTSGFSIFVLQMVSAVCRYIPKKCSADWGGKEAGKLCPAEPSFSAAAQGSTTTPSLPNGAILSAWARHLIWTPTLYKMRKEVLMYPSISPWKEFQVISPIMKSQPWNSYSGRTIGGKIPITARLFFLLITTKNLLHIITFWMRASMQ